MPTASRYSFSNRAGPDFVEALVANDDCWPIRHPSYIGHREHWQRAGLPPNRGELRALLTR
ncbi:MAG: hypothetical protein ACRCYQ_15055 [Nocardioides sp.]